MSAKTRMYQEAAEAPQLVGAQLTHNAPLLRELGERLRRKPPRAVVTCARGSSDHAATYAKYLVESHTHVLTSSAAPSVSSIYEAQADLEGVLFIAISQSGMSPDLLTATRNAREGGAVTVALCNSPAAPLMNIVDVAVPLQPPQQEERLRREETARKVRAALARVRPVFRVPLVLRHIEGLSYEEIGRVLQIAPGTVASRLSRGQLQLGRMLRNAVPETE